MKLEISDLVFLEMADPAWIGMQFPAPPPRGTWVSVVQEPGAAARAWLEGPWWKICWWRFRVWFRTRLGN